MANSRSSAETAGLPTVIGHYAISASEVTDLAEVIRENVGPGGLGRFDLDQVKIPAGGGTTWEVPTLDGPEPRKDLTGIIIHYADQRAYWADVFGGGNSPPQCSSVDALVGVGDPGGSCGTCPFSRFGTARRQDGAQGRGQACRLVRVLFMLLPSGILPIVVAVPPSSLKDLRKYFTRLASQGVAYHAVQTKLRLVQDRSSDGITFSKVAAEFAGRLSAEEARRVKPLRDMLQAQAEAAVDVRTFAN